MFVHVEQMIRFVGEGRRFEQLLHDLIRHEAVTCNIPQQTIHWDDRVNVPDGGRDIVCEEGSSNRERFYLPVTKAIWSAKSGKDGLSATQLEKEIVDHPKVISHLRDGGTYVWCTVLPASQDGREALQIRGAEVAERCGFDKGQIVFIFRDTLFKWLKDYPGLVRVYLEPPMQAKRLDQWRRLDVDYDVDWVNFGARSDFIERIKDHFLSQHSKPMLYITGRSGIGKTRATLQACLSNPVLHSVLYYETVDAFYHDEAFYDSSGECAAFVVIDDVQISEWDKLHRRMGSFSRRLRIVAIGPTIVGGTTGYDEILEVSVPESSHVMEVIKVSNPEIPDEDVKWLANQCDHDLRLALLLSSIYLRDPYLRNPLSRVQHVWDRVIHCFAPDLGDTEKFKELYEILCLCLDIGNRDEHRIELTYIASYFQKRETDFDRAMDMAIKCRLGRQQGRFFEASPAALARWLFEERAWPLIRNNASAFVEGIPTERMRRRLFERGQESSECTGMEVSSALAEWFRTRFPIPSLSAIFDRDSSRIFLSYAELNPMVGLTWLKEAVVHCSPADLEMFDGNPDGSGGWRGRRQVVWLCEHLSYFEEYFWDCEEILFNLACHETEPDIGNNSIATWSGLFLPIFSWSTIPFLSRFEFLLRRLRHAAEKEEEFVLRAAIGTLDIPSGRISPPRTVGGRLVPEEVRPKTYEELYTLQNQAGEQLLQVIKEEVDPLRKGRMARGIIPSLSLFVRHGCLTALRALFLDFPRESDIVRILRGELDQYRRQLSFLKAHGKLNVNDDVLKKLISWYQELEPASLEGRIKEITQGFVWGHYYSSDSETGMREEYGALARDTLRQVDVLDDLDEWFHDADQNSLSFFGYYLGLEDSQLVLLGRMVQMIERTVHEVLVSGYMRGMVVRNGTLEGSVSAALDDLLDEHPEYVSKVTLSGDYSVSGLERLKKSLVLADPETRPSLLFIEFGREPWCDFIDEETKIELLDLLWVLYEGGDDYAIKISIDLAARWYQEFAEIASESVSQKVLILLTTAMHSDAAYQLRNWDSLIRKLPRRYDAEAIRLYATALTARRPGHFKDVGLEGLVDYAKTSPHAVMEAVGSKMLNPETRPFFFIDVYRDLFESIGLSVIKEWAKVVGEEGVVAMARHLASPGPVESDPTFVPPLTKWVLSEFEHSDRVFSSFCTGRYSFKVWCGNELEEYQVELQKQLRPYFQHELRRVREWAEYERSWIASMIREDEKYSQEYERL